MCVEAYRSILKEVRIALATFIFHVVCETGSRVLHNVTLFLVAMVSCYGNYME